MSRGDPLVVYFGAPARGPEFAQLDMACRFYGFHLNVSSGLEEGSPGNIAITPDGSLPILLVVHASELDKLPPTRWRDLQAAADRQRVPIAVVGITTDCDTGILSKITSVAGVRVSAAGPDCGLWVAATDPSSTGFELRGIRLALGPGMLFNLESAAGPAVRVLATVGSSELGSQPAMLRIDQGTSVQYLLACTAGVTTESLGPWEFRRSYYGEVTPFFLLLRDAGGPRCWRPAAAVANLTIDDPWLTEPYGCLTFPGLLAEMLRERFHSTIGFVPWNYDRSTADVVALIRDNPQCFSIAIHGNNHDRYEFFRYESQAGDNQRAKPLALQTFNIREAVARMEEFHHSTGLDFDRVMVFPHGVSPAATLGVLKENGFWATSNYSNVPLGELPPSDPAVALRAVNTECSDFPALRRNYPQNLSEEAIAIDLFLGNPVMFMAHQDLFFDGIDAFNSYAKRVNTRQPAVRWMSLGEISRHLHLIRWPDENHCEVRLNSRHAKVKNPKSVPVEFRFTKRESRDQAIDGVKVGTKEVSWRHEGGELCFAAKIPPGEECLVELIYRLPACGAKTDIRRRGLRNRSLRLITDFRDLTLSRTVIGRRMLRKYYVQGKRRPTVSGLLSHLKALVRGKSP